MIEHETEVHHINFNSVFHLGFVGTAWDADSKPYNLGSQQNMGWLFIPMGSCEETAALIFRMRKGKT